MTERIEKLKAALYPGHFPLCTEKSRLITESYKQTTGEPIIMRQAKAFAHCLDHIPIFIENRELIVGNTASKPLGIEIAHEGSLWSKEELDSLRKEGFSISDEDVKVAEEVGEYWKYRSTEYVMGQVYDEKRLWPYMQSSVVLPPWKSRKEGRVRGRASGGMGFTPSIVSIDFKRVLEEGLLSVIHEAENQLDAIRFVEKDAVKNASYLKAVIHAHRAIIRFAKRFSKLAKELSLRERDIVRKKELERIAEICQRVPAHPAEGFYEAIQSYWFIYLMVASGVTPLDRFDQLMYPLYRKDMDNGHITDDEVLELLQHFRIKNMQVNLTFTRSQRAKWSGMAKWNNMIVGGQTPEGDDATNELSYLILEAAKRCPTPHHTITVRVHDKTPESLMIKALEVVKTGIGMPAFVGDTSYIDYLVNQGAPLEDARNYAIGGCLDVVIPGQSRVGALPLMIIPLVFEFFMHNGREPETGRQLGPQTGNFENFKSFEDVLTAFKQQLAYFIGLQTECNNIQIEVARQLKPDPVVSSLMKDAIKEKRELYDPTLPYRNISAITPVGMINVADSLGAIKKLVFQDKTVTMKTLKEALSANWQGEYAELHRRFLAAPKYGNDDDEVDAIVQDLYRFFAETVSSFPCNLGGTFNPSGVSISAHQPGGALVGAMPDGRCAGEILADGTMSPAHGRDQKGPLAVIKSASKVDQTPYQSTLLNMKFHPSALASTEDLKKLSSLIRTYFKLGGKHIQFNVLDRDTLLKAKKHPEQHRDLIVRVAGYSAYFTQLGSGIQDEIIARTEYTRTI